MKKDTNFLDDRFVSRRVIGHHSGQAGSWLNDLPAMVLENEVRNLDDWADEQEHCMDRLYRDGKILFQVCSARSQKVVSVGYLTGDVESSVDENLIPITRQGTLGDE